MIASLKKDAGKKEMRMIIRCGGTDIPERLQGWRKYEKCNTVDIFLKTNEGKLSGLTIPPATLVEYDGKSLKIYDCGERELNEEESQAMKEWNDIKNTEEYKKQAEIDMLTDGSSTYWKQKWFWENKGLGYMFNSRKNMYDKTYNHNTGKVVDPKVKGKLSMEYEVREAA